MTEAPTDDALSVFDDDVAVSEARVVGPGLVSIVVLSVIATPGVIAVVWVVGTFVIPVIQDVLSHGHFL